MGGELVLVSAYLTVTPLITDGPEHTHTYTLECAVVSVIFFWSDQYTTLVVKKWCIIANASHIWTSSIFLSPFLLKHNRETQNSLPTNPNSCELLTGTVTNMLMKRFVGGVMIGASTWTLWSWYSKGAH